MPSWSKLIQIAAIGVLALSTGFLPSVSGQCTIPEFDALIAQTTHKLNAGNYPARIQKNQQQGKMARVAQLQAEFAHLNDDLARWNRRRARVLAGGPCVLTPGGVPPPVVAPVAPVAPYPYGYYRPGYPGYYPGSRYIPPRVTPSGRVIPGHVREAEIDDAIEADDAEAELDDDSTDQVDDATAETDDAAEQVDDATAEVDETPVEENVAEVDGALDADEEELQFKKKKRNEAEIDSAVEAESASVPIEPVSAPLATEHENKNHHRGRRHHRNRRHRRSHHPRLGVSVNVHVKA